MKHLVMLGAGLAHLHVLRSLAVQPLADVQVTLVASGPAYFHPAFLAGHLAGHLALEGSSVPLAPLVAGSAATWLQGSAVGLDVAQRQVALGDGSTLDFDVLSLHSGPWHDRQKIEQRMPGARQHALFAYPCEALAALWPQVLAFAGSRALRVAVVGGSPSAVELALALAQRWPGASVTLLTGDAALAAGHAQPLQERLLRTLQNHHITLLRDTVRSAAEGLLTLGSGAELACDLPLIASDADAPPWLQGSGLATDETGFSTVDAFGRATDHPEVFAVGAQAGPALAQNLRAALAGQAPAVHTPPLGKLHFVDCGERTAIANWGRFCAQGRWVGWLKNRLDQRSIAPFASAAT